MKSTTHHRLRTASKSSRGGFLGTQFIFEFLALFCLIGVALSVLVLTGHIKSSKPRPPIEQVDQDKEGEMIFRAGSASKPSVLSPIYKLSVSTRSNRFVYCDVMRQGRLHDLETGELITWFGANNQQVSTTSLSPDGKSILIGTMEGETTLWRNEKNHNFLPFDLPRHSGQVTVTAISSDSRLAASGGQDSRIFLWDLAEQTLLHTLDNHGGAIEHINFSSDGQMLVSADFDGYVKVLSTVSGHILAEFGPLEDRATVAAFSPDNRSIVFGGSHDSIRKHDLKTGTELWRIDIPELWPMAMAYSPDGKFISWSGQDGRIHLVAAESGKQINVMIGHEKSVRCLQFGEEGRLLFSAGYDGQVRRWDTTTWHEASNVE